MEKRALLVVDVQKGFINQHTAHIPALVERILPSYDLVFATRFFNREASNYRRLIKWTRFSRGTEETELAFRAGEGVLIIEKSGYSCVNENFIKKLDDAGIGEVHIAGMDTDVCVLKCAVDLFDSGRTPVVLSSFCASHAGPEFHFAALRIISRSIGAGQVVE